MTFISEYRKQLEVSHATYRPISESTAQSLLAAPPEKLKTQGLTRAMIATCEVLNIPATWDAILERLKIDETKIQAT